MQSSSKIVVRFVIGAALITGTGMVPESVSAQSGESRIAFVSTRDGNPEIYVMDADGSNPVRLTTHPGYDGAPTWSPDGTRIAFASSRTGNSDIFIMDADGSNVMQLTTDPADDGGPSWSPDGSMIAFDSDRSGSSQVWRMNVDAGAWGYNLTQLTADHPLGRVNNFLSLSPDGRWVAFEADRDRDDPEIYLASAVDGTNQQRLTYTRALDEVPTWTPDSRQIVYSTDRDGEPQNGNYEIYIMSVDGSNKRRLTDSPGQDSNPSVSGDGTQIVFDSARSGAVEIYVMNLDGSNPVRLTRSGTAGSGDDDGVSNSNPAWSPHVAMRADPPAISAEYAFDSDFRSYFVDHPAWSSEEAEIVQEGGRARLSATGTWISEAWKTWHQPLPHDRDWSIAVDATVPLEWDSAPTAEAQVGAGPWLGRLDPAGKGRRVYEVNLATIANEIRFVQGQLIKNRLGEDPIDGGHIAVTDETVRLEINYDAEARTISLAADGVPVDTQAIDSAGSDDWGMTGDDVFYVGVMGFAENVDLREHFVTMDNFAVWIGSDR